MLQHGTSVEPTDCVNKKQRPKKFVFDRWMFRWRTKSDKASQITINGTIIKNIFLNGNSNIKKLNVNGKYQWTTI